MRTTQSIGSSRFEPIADFRAFATDPTARVTLKEPAMFDLVSAIRQSRKTYEALVSIRGAIVAGGEREPLLADAHARFKEQATAMGYLVDQIDDAAMIAVEGQSSDPGHGGKAMASILGVEHVNPTRSHREAAE